MTEEDKTVVQVLDRSLGRYGRPKRNSASSGRFIFQWKEFLDPAVYEEGANITVFGRLMAMQDEKIGNKSLKIPVVEAKEIHLWPNYSNVDCDYRYPSYPYGGYYHPYGFRRNFYGPLFYRYNAF